MKQIFSFFLLALCSFVTAAAQSIPTYTTVVTTPADGATVSSLTSVTVSLSREGFDAPLGIMPGSQPVTATKVVGTTQTPIDGITAAVRGENLVITFSQLVAEVCTVNISIPEGVTNNLAMPVATMTTDEIIAEGGCTNPAIALTLNVVPTVVPVKDVTGVGYDTKYLTDEQGNFIKDENGQYIRQDKYDSLIDAQLTPATDAQPDGDRVTVLYFWYDQPFATINYTGGASVTNVTTGQPMAIANVCFKTGGDAYRNNVIELRLMSTDFIYSAEYHQGVYQVTLPEGIATTADGLKSGGITFSFTFGDPSQAFKAEDLNLDDFLGDYRSMADEGDEQADEAFTLCREADAQGKAAYYVTALNGSALRIPVAMVGQSIFLCATDDDDLGAFMSLTGGDVEAVFTAKDGEHYIFVDQYALYDANFELTMGGTITYKRESPALPDAVSSAALPARCPSASYDLQGRRVKAAGRGIVISKGRKAVQ